MKKQMQDLQCNFKAQETENRKQKLLLDREISFLSLCPARRLRGILDEELS